ncbi:hypothetical protein CCACVL1_24599, partial [Corchorus capsularis]
IAFVAQSKNRSAVAYNEESLDNVRAN